MKITNIFLTLSVLCAAQMSGAQVSTDLKFGDTMAPATDALRPPPGHGGGGNHGGGNGPGGGGGNHGGGNGPGGGGGNHGGGWGDHGGGGNHGGDHGGGYPPPYPPPHPHPEPVPVPNPRIVLEHNFNLVYTGYNRISLSSVMNLNYYRGYRVESVEVTVRNFDQRSTRFVLTADGRYQDQREIFGTNYQNLVMFPGYSSEIGRDFYDLGVEIQGAVVVDRILVRLSRY